MFWREKTSLIIIRDCSREMILLMKMFIFVSLSMEIVFPVLNMRQLIACCWVLSFKENVDRMSDVKIECIKLSIFKAQFRAFLFVCRVSNQVGQYFCYNQKPVCVQNNTPRINYSWKPTEQIVGVGGGGGGGCRVGVVVVLIT